LIRLCTSSISATRPDAARAPYCSRLLLALACAAAAPLHAGACDAAPYRQFDFWLGHWQVHTPDGKLAGTSRIEREYSGCVIHEHYANPRGFEGESLNSYDSGRRLWHQTWVDNQGSLLLLEGGLRGDSMVLEGRARDAHGTITRQRITWTPHPDGSVRQLWEATDGHGHWSTVFDGRYSHQP
jgi:hypothetical protein